MSKRISVWHKPWLSDADGISPVSHQQLSWPNVIIPKVLGTTCKSMECGG